MNNFIVWQVTPDVLSDMPCGTSILFGLLTDIGPAFIWLSVLETRGLRWRKWTSYLNPRARRSRAGRGWRILTYSLPEHQY